MSNQFTFLIKPVSQYSEFICAIRVINPDGLIILDDVMESSEKQTQACMTLLAARIGFECLAIAGAQSVLVITDFDNFSTGMNGLAKWKQAGFPLSGKKARANPDIWKSIDKAIEGITITARRPTSEDAHIWNPFRVQIKQLEKHAYSGTNILVRQPKKKACPELADADDKSPPWD